MVRTAAGQVYLVGFMGAGKTTAGRHLASLLGWEFADLDEMICRGEGRSIPEIFRDQGEPHFRLREREAARPLFSMSAPNYCLGAAAAVGVTTHFSVSPLALTLVKLRCVHHNAIRIFEPRQGTPPFP